MPDAVGFQLAERVFSGTGRHVWDGPAPSFVPNPCSNGPVGLIPITTGPFGVFFFSRQLMPQPPGVSGAAHFPRPTTASAHIGGAAGGVSVVVGREARWYSYFP
jgi:hypothetical protein